MKSAVKKETYIDTPETEKLFLDMHSRYTRSDQWDHFAAAFGILLSSTDDWRDVIGDTYMQFNVANKHTGQFFTPWDIAECMAMINLHDAEKMLHDRMKKALSKDPLGLSLLLTSLVIEDPDESAKWFYEKIVPAAAPNFERITVYDPCVGSGVMLLAAAKQFPKRALDVGFVQFYGTDIDATCVKMARLNCMLYGLNGFSLKCAMELSDLDLEQVPEPFASSYKEAKTATPERLEEIKHEVRWGTAVQMGLFAESLNVSDPQ